MRRLRALATVAALALSGLAPSVAMPTVACASEAGPHAALVVDTGSRTLRLCVTLDAASVTGIHLIELAGRQHGLQHSFGFGGQAVCSLAGVGVTGGDCFAEYPEYWGYWRGDHRGGWSWAPSGAASARVGDGDVEGWVWGTGDSGTTHDRPPRTRIVDVCAVPEPDPEPSAEPPPSSEDAIGSNGGSGDDPSSPPSQGKQRKDRDRPEPSPSEPPADPELRALAGGGPAATSGGPPPALYLALVATGALVVAGRIRRRRRVS